MEVDDLRTPVLAVVLAACAAFSCSKHSAATSCSSAAECVGAQVCVAGVCQDPAPPPGAGALGGACATDGDCSSGLGCLSGAFPGGVCTTSCLTAGCPGQSRCTDLRGQVAGAEVCLPACQSAASCRSGYTCCAASGSVCVPAALCASGAGCSAAPRLVSGGTAGPVSPPAGCQRQVQASAFPGAQSLGTQAVGTTLQFQVPEGAASVSIVSQGLSAVSSVALPGFVLPNSVVPTLVKLPDGGVVYDDSAQPPGDVSNALAFYGGASAWSGTLTIPNTTAALRAFPGGLPGGTWSMTVNDFALECLSTPGCDGGTTSGSYDVTVLARPGPAASAGTIDVAFYLAVSGGLTAAGAPADAHVQRMVQTLAALYAKAGVCVGTVTFYDLPGWAQSRYATGIDAAKDSVCENLGQMFTLSRPGNVLNFFLVQSITSSGAGGTQVIGIDGTIPGPSSVGGTVHSGAAVSMADLNAGTCAGPLDLAGCGADNVAYIAAHEGGHWMGLYHTTESDGLNFDPLSDTPICHCEECVSAGEAAKCADKTPAPTTPAQVSARACNGAQPSCAGGDNLMFWLIDDAVSQGKLSPQQGQVMLANPLVK